MNDLAKRTNHFLDLRGVSDFPRLTDHDDVLNVTVVLIQHERVQVLKQRGCTVLVALNELKELLNRKLALWQLFEDYWLLVFNLTGEQFLKHLLLQRVNV